MNDQTILEYLNDTPEDDIYFRILTGTGQIMKVKTGKNTCTEVYVYYT